MVSFDKGMAGVAVVVLSLIASIGLGVITNIDESESTQSVEKYVADITGAYSAQKDQAYVDFTPATNYSGYSIPNTDDGYPVIIDSVPYANNYPITYTGGSDTYDCTSSNIDTILGTTTHSGFLPSESLDELFFMYASFQSSKIVHSYKDTAILPGKTVRNAMTIYDDGIGHNGQRYIPLSEVFEKAIEKSHDARPLTTIDQIKITIPITVSGYVTIPHVYEDYNMNATSTFYYVDNYFQIRDSSKRVYDFGYTQGNLQEVGVGNAINISLTYVPSTGVAIIEMGSVAKYVYQDISKLYLTWAPSDPFIFTRTYMKTTLYTWDEEDQSVEDSTSARTYVGPYNNTLNITTTYDVTTSYLDVRYGVGIPNDRTVTWTNGEKNGITDIVFHADNGESSYSDTAIIYTEKDKIISTDMIRIERSEGISRIAINSDSPIDIGVWTDFLLRIDSVNGKITVIPISTWVSFTDYILSDIPVPIGTISHKGDLIKIDWTAVSTYRLSVVNTQVFLNTYGVVMLNPSITITNLWPNYTHFMLNFTKVANVGNRITIGDQTFDIEEDLIHIHGKKLDFKNLKIYFTKIVSEGQPDRWNVELVANNESEIIETFSTYIGMEGVWYFNSGMYNITTENVKTMLWDAIYIPDVTNILFFMFIALVLLSVILYKKGMLDFASGIIIFVTGIIVILMIGGA